MRRREFIALVGASVAWPFAAMAQQAGRTYRLGGVSSIPSSSPILVAMFDELKRPGFIAGQNLTVDWHTYGAEIDLIPKFVAELVKAHVDVIYVGGDVAIRAAQQATPTIPILAPVHGADPRRTFRHFRCHRAGQRQWFTRLAREDAGVTQPAQPVG
jgi:putative ABC transport system substrate-binding protein